MPARRSARARAPLTSAPSPPPALRRPGRPGRPRRAAPDSAVKVMRDESKSPDESKKALRLTMKMPSSKLREATSNPRSRPSSRGNPAAKLTDSLTGGEIVSGPRTNRANKKYVVESESDEDESNDEEEEDDEIQPSEADQDDDEEDEEEEPIGGPEESDEDEGEAEDEDQDEDAEADPDADADADGDEDMDDSRVVPSRQPILKVKGPAAKPGPKAASKPIVTVTPAQADKVKSVEAKEMEMDDDDEELSDLSEDDDEEGDVGEEDAEEDVDEEMGDGDDSRSPGSRGSTPDVSKMTKRQRSRLDQVMGGDFLQLPMGKFYRT